MKTKTKLIFSTMLAGALIALPRAQAVTGDATPMTAPAAASPSGTNNKPADVMAALFGDPVIVKGTGFEIKQSQLEVVADAFKARTSANGQTVAPDEITRTALNSLIVNQLLLQMATGADKAQGQKEADQYIAQTVKHYGSQAVVDEQLKAAGKTFDGWRTEMAQQTTATAVMIRVLDAAPTDAQIQKFYETNALASEVPEMVHVRHILLLTIDPATRAPLTDDQIKAKKKQIDDLLKQARGGADFAALAKQYTEDPGSKDGGGELPPFAKASADPSHAMVPEFEVAAFSMTNNQISEVITTQYGYHIIKLIEKTPARKLALTDKLPESDTTLSEQIKNFLTDQKLRELAPAYIDKLSKSPGVEILDPALKTIMSASTKTPAAPTAN